MFRFALAIAAFFALVPLVAGAQEQPVPLSLRHAVELALQNNPAYRIVVAGVDVASARVTQARAGLAPTAGLSYTYQYANPVAQLATPFGALPFGPNATMLPLASATYTLFNPALMAQAGAAAANLAQARANERDARASTVAAVSRAYYDLAVAQGSELVTAGAQQLALRHVKDAKQRFAAGQVPRSDVLDATATAAQRRVDLIQARNVCVLAQNSLDAIMNVPMQTLHVLADGFPSSPPGGSIESLVASAEQTRGEIVAARASIDAARYTLDAARAGRKAVVTTSISEGNVQPIVQQGFKAQFIFSLQAVWKVFDGGLAGGAQDEARAEVDRAQFALQKSMNDVELDVRQSYASVLSARERVQATHVFVTAAEESERLAGIRYRGGVGTSLELRDAQMRALTAAESYIAARADFARSIISLRFAAGLL